MNSDENSKLIQSSSMPEVHKTPQRKTEERPSKPTLPDDEKAGENKPQGMSKQQGHTLLKEKIKERFNNFKSKFHSISFFIGLSVAIVISMILQQTYSLYDKTPWSVQQQKYREELQASKQMQHVVSVTHAVLFEWQRFHLQPDKITEGQKREMDSDLNIALKLYDASLIKDLNYNWKIYALYNYSYAKMISVDFAYDIKKQEIINDAIVIVEKLQGIFKEHKSKLDFPWLKAYNIPQDLAKLTALIYARDFNLNPKDKEKAKKAIHALMDLPKTELQKQEVTQDRILKSVLKLAIEQKKINLSP